MVYTVKDLYVDLMWIYCVFMWIYVDLFAPKWIYGVHNFGQMFTPRLPLYIAVDVSKQVVYDDIVDCICL